MIRDLLAAELCRSTWHVIHCAAMFARSNGTRVQKFFPQTSEILPDFLLDAEGLLIAVEAKLLTKSEKEEKFESWASDLAKQIFQEAIPLDGIQPVLVIVVKSAEALPEFSAVVETVRLGVKRYSGGGLILRSLKFNVFIEPPSLPRTGMTSYRHCTLLCSRSPNEDIRIQDRSKRASRQIAGVAKGEYPGLLCLGLTRVQHPQHIIQLLRNRFSRGQYSAISSVMLLETGTHGGLPKRSTVDVLGFVKNERAKRAIPGNLKFRCLGLLGHIEENLPMPNEVAAYRYMLAEGKISKETHHSLFLPDIRMLTPNMLQ